MSPSAPLDWFPACYRREDLPAILAEELGVTPAVARVAAALPEHGEATAVAAALDISPHTVKAHCRQLTMAVGTTSRARACAAVVAAVWRRALADGAHDAPLGE